jgi:hypothetical protein
LANSLTLRGPACRSYDQVSKLLAASVTCSILAPAGTHRRRLLAMLYKDERVAEVTRVPQFPFLEKMFMERLITPCAPPPTLVLSSGTARALFISRKWKFWGTSDGVIPDSFNVFCGCNMKHIVHRNLAVVMFSHSLVRYE